MSYVELGTLLIRADTKSSIPIGTSCRVQWNKQHYVYFLLAENDVVFAVNPYPANRRAWAGSVIESIGYALRHRRIESEGSVVHCGDDECMISFTIRVPIASVLGKQIEQPCRHCAHIFANLTPIGSTTPRDAIHVDPRKQLHSLKITELFPLLNTAEESLNQLAFQDVTDKSWIEKLPLATLNRIFDFCDPISFRALQCTCRLLYFAAKDSIPSIRTELCSHQRKSLRWMIWREQSGHTTKDFCKQTVSSDWGSLQIDEVRGLVYSKVSDCVEDVRGGILADEPGLGKTATILSLIMRSKGVLATPPINCSSFIRPDQNGQDIGWYRIESSLSSVAAARSSRSLRSSSRPSTDSRSSHSTIEYPLEEVSEESEAYTTPRKRQQISHAEFDDDTAMRENLTSEELLTRTSSARLSNGALPELITDYWVQCDTCNAWKNLPEDHQVAADASWHCIMHPDPSQAYCDAATVGMTNVDALVLRATGYIPIERSSTMNTDNVGHFTLYLIEFKYYLTNPVNAVSALFQLRPSDFTNGFTVPLEYRIPSNYAPIYQSLGLIRSTSRKRSSSNDVDLNHRWCMPQSHRLLTLDLGALRAALLSITKQEKSRRYLSSATLIVVPYPLIEQWKQEIQKHFTGSHLRVLVLTKKEHYPVRIAQIAWNYDVVLTSFTHLSCYSSDGLLQIHWLRVVLDEGHLLGSTLNRTSRKERIFALSTERRWIITGTPTPDLAHHSTATHLYPLMQFLRVHPYSSARIIWENAIQRPFEAGLPEGVRRLLALLNRLMIRSFKSEIHDIVRVEKNVVSLNFEQAHAASYNELVEVVQRNLLLADFGEEGHRESLLNPANNKWASEMLRNLHMSCCVAGNCFLQINEEQLADTLSKLAMRNGYSMESEQGHVPILPNFHPLRSVENALREGGRCVNCSDSVRLPLVTPCAHILCVNCLRSDRYKCIRCQTPYAMQSASDKTRLMLNSNPKLPVPIEVIEWQSSYTQAGAVGKSGGGWHPDWRATESSKCKQLVKRLREIGVCDFTRERKPKAIVFSSFWAHISLINRSLLEANIPHCVLKRGVPARHKNDVVHMFRTDPEATVLVMDATGAVGLDLSMASWVFLMDPLLDRSVEEQIISRAHRMGAKQDVRVEIMTMKGSIEETYMTHFGVKDTNQSKRKQVESVDENRTVRNSLISGLKRVRDH